MKGWVGDMSEEETRETEVININGVDFVALSELMNAVRICDAWKIENDKLKEALKFYANRLHMDASTRNMKVGEESDGLIEWVENGLVAKEALEESND